MYFIISSLRRDYTRPDLPSGPNETHFSADIAGLLGEMLSLLQLYLYLFLSFKEKTLIYMIIFQYFASLHTHTHTLSWFLFFLELYFFISLPECFLKFAKSAQNIFMYVG